MYNDTNHITRNPITVVKLVFLATNNSLIAWLQSLPSFIIHVLQLHELKLTCVNVLPLCLVLENAKVGFV